MSTCTRIGRAMPTSATVTVTALTSSIECVHGRSGETAGNGYFQAARIMLNGESGK
jgi:hypothetical protein